MNIKHTQLRGMVALTTALGITGLTALTTPSQAAPGNRRNDNEVREQRRDVKEARRDLQRERQELRREKQEHRVENRYDYRYDNQHSDGSGSVWNNGSHNWNNGNYGNRSNSGGFGQGYAATTLTGTVGADLPGDQFSLRTGRGNFRVVFQNIKEPRDVKPGAVVRVNGSQRGNVFYATSISILRRA